MAYCSTSSSTRWANPLLRAAWGWAPLSRRGAPARWIRALPAPVTAFLALSAERLRKAELGTALRGLALVSLGLYSHYWLLLNVSGFRSPCSALACMLVTRSLLAHPYLHVNIFQVRCPPPWALGGKGEHSPSEEAPPHLPPSPLLFSLWVATESFGLR